MAQGGTKDTLLSGQGGYANWIIKWYQRGSLFALNWLSIQSISPWPIYMWWYNWNRSGHIFREAIQSMNTNFQCDADGVYLINHTSRQAIYRQPLAIWIDIFGSQPCSGPLYGRGEGKYFRAEEEKRWNVTKGVFLSPNNSSFSLSISHNTNNLWTTSSPSPYPTLDIGQVHHNTISKIIQNYPFLGRPHHRRGGEKQLTYNRRRFDSKRIELNESLITTYRQIKLIISSTLATHTFRWQYYSQLSTRQWLA